MGSYTENPTIQFPGEASTNNKSVATKPSIMGASGQTAIANYEAISFFLQYLDEQLKFKGLQINNVAQAAESQAAAQIQQGKDELMGAIASGISMLAAGAASGYAGYKIGEQTATQQANLKTEFDNLQQKSPGILNDLAKEDGTGIGRPGTYNENGLDRTPISEDNFNKLLKDPTKLDQAELDKIKLENSITPEQRQQLTEQAAKFENGTADAQQEIRKSIMNNSRADSTEIQFKQTFISEFSKGAGDMVKGAYSAEAAKEGAAVTNLKAAQDMASLVEQVLSGNVNQAAQLIEALLQVQAQLASATIAH